MAKLPIASKSSVLAPMSDKITQSIEEDVIAALEDMLGALKKRIKDMEDKKNQPQPSNSQPQDPPLVDVLAELKEIAPSLLPFVGPAWRVLDEENRAVPYQTMHSESACNGNVNCRTISRNSVNCEGIEGQIRKQIRQIM